MHPEDKQYSADSTQSTDLIDSSHSTHSTHFEKPVLPDSKSRRGGTALNTLSTVLFYLAILFFIIGFNFRDVMVGNWYQQFLPNIGGRSITDITFIDSLTGYCTTSPASDTSYILKTTNSGDNWSILYSSAGFIMNSLQFFNQNTGYVGGTHIIKTTDGGNSWNLVSSSLFLEEFYFTSIDTGWFVKSNSLTGGVFFTSNSGASWQNQLNLGSQNPNHIYMYNARIGFVSTGGGLYKTSNSGVNWALINGGAFLDIYFSDSLTGWKNNGTATVFQKTTNGGMNWTTYNLPPEEGIIILSRLKKFDNVIKDTIFGVGSVAFFGAGQFRGLIYKSTNGGQTWGYQLPDTSIHSGQLQHVEFEDKVNGWAYWTSGGVHTTNGGDTTFYTGIVQTGSNVPASFELKQNYPNPFNPRTVIPYKLKQPAYVRLIAYEITGRETQIMVNQHQQAGEYEVDFIGKFAASSGVYFYRMEVTDDKSRQLFTETKKMILIK